MTRRATILTALVAVLVMASGAMGQSWRVRTGTHNDGFVVKKITFEPGSIDTANYLDGEAALVNDSLIFTSPAFTIKQPWTVCQGRLFYETQDTVSVLDSIGYILQSKFENQYDSTWWTLATCAKADEDLINTNPSTADLKVYWDADSLGVGDYYRIQVALMAEEAQWRAEDVSGIIQFNAKYHWYLMFVHKGSQ
jgi:hypothetical protein